METNLFQTSEQRMLLADATDNKLVLKRKKNNESISQEHGFQFSCHPKPKHIAGLVAIRSPKLVKMPVTLTYIIRISMVLAI